TWSSLAAVTAFEAAYGVKFPKATAKIRHRTKITKGPGSRAAGLAMAFKLIESAQDRWRAVNAPHLVALVRAGAVFVNGKLVERPGEDAPP
ncbi:MAG: IS256 family transposase, partial [Trebonia sp.]